MKEKKLVFTTKTMAYMAIFAALQIVLEYLTKFTPQMPQGGNIAFSLIAIFLCAYLMGWKYGVIVSLVCFGLQFALGLAQFWGPYSLLLDYLLPLIVIGISPLFGKVRYKEMVIPVGMFIAIVIKTISHVIAGMLQFDATLSASLTYNLPYNIGTLIACFILFMILYPRLKNTIKL